MGSTSIDCTLLKLDTIHNLVEMALSHIFVQKNKKKINKELLSIHRAINLKQFKKKKLGIRVVNNILCFFY